MRLSIWLVAFALAVVLPGAAGAQAPDAEAETGAMEKPGDGMMDEKGRDEKAVAEKGMEGKGMAGHEGMAAEKGETAAEAGLPLLVEVYADWCGKCQAIAGTMRRVEEELAGESARVVILDVTDDATLAQARQRARELGIDEFFEQHRSRTGTVAVFEPGSSEPSRVLVAEKDFAKYREAVESAATT